MTMLRQRMLENLKLRGMSESTQEAYVRAVRQLAEHYEKSSDQISDEELRQYFLYLKNVRGIAENTLRVSLSGIKFYYKYTLKREFPTLELMRVQRMKKLPVVLSISEVRQILGRVQQLRYRSCLTLIYSCGLRLREGLFLKVENINRKARDARIVMYRYSKAPWNCCGSTGQSTGIRCGSFQPQTDREEHQWSAVRFSSCGTRMRYPETRYSAHAPP